MNGTSRRPARHTPGARTLGEITADLARRIPERLLEHKTRGGQRLTYIPWYRAQKILDHYAPGWSGSVVSITTTRERVFVVYRVTIPTAEGAVSREATGTELLDCSSYGDPTSNAESMAFRRACARFGLGLYLYDQ